jgi:hypothetical protein
MNAPMVGSWLVEVRACRPYTIHGDLYYEIHAVRTDEDAGPDPGADAGARPLFGLRVPQHATDGPPQPGDRLRVVFLMGQVTSAKKEAGE